MLKIITVIGTRPQFVKAAVLSRLILKEYSDRIKEILVHTGQHYDSNMSAVFLKELKLPNPDYNLGIGSCNHGKQTAMMLLKLEALYMELKPDLVLLYGDTNSTIAGSLSASKLHIPIAHVEAGLRSFNMLMPEEQNRILTDHLSSILFCPTDTAVENLKRENIYDGKKVLNSLGEKIIVKNSGDIMLDAIILYKETVEKKNILNKLGLIEKNFILATIHRAENTDNKKRLQEIFEAFREIKESIILPLHPRTKKFLYKYGIKLSKNIKIIEPIGYLDMICLEAAARIIMTDSGGIQKEAFFLKTPCITLRDETEWIETLISGWNFLCPAHKNTIKNAYAKIMNIDFNSKEQAMYFGNGEAGKNILSIILNAFRR